MRKILNLEVEVSVADFEYGQKVYAIRYSGDRYERYNSECPVCNGTKKVTINGFEFYCPNCYCSNGKSATVDCLPLTDYEIVEYIVNKIEIRGEETKSCYNKNSDSYAYPKVRYSAFTRTGNSYNSISTMCLPTLKDAVDPDPGRFEDGVFYSIKDYVFTTKKAAVDVVKVLKQIDKDKLEKFNKDHGTNHTYQW